MAREGSLILLVLGILGINVAGGLVCYQCADTTIDTTCSHDQEGLINTTRGLNDFYAQDCTESNPRWDRCVIEEHKGMAGQHLLFKRGCHDGRTFNSITEDVEFRNLTPNNDSTCQFTKSQRLICFRFCNTSFCNGPQAPPLPTTTTEKPCIPFNPYDNRTLEDDEEFCGGMGVRGSRFTVWMLQLLTGILVWLLCRKL